MKNLSALGILKTPLEAEANKAAEFVNTTIDELALPVHSIIDERFLSRTEGYHSYISTIPEEWVYHGWIERMFHDLQALMVENISFKREIETANKLKKELAEELCKAYLTCERKELKF